MLQPGATEGLTGGSTVLKVTAVLGGELNKTSLENTSPSSLIMLKQLWCDISFIGVNGLDENGPGTVDEYEARTNQAMVNHTTLPIIVTDSSKFGKVSFASLGDDAAIPHGGHRYRDSSQYAPSARCPRL
ncbi:MAG: hypothetical protein Q3976_04140 [Corynebacterium sp.]|nr:hypothetical protein [Corynebacterium sp.]